MPTTFGWAVSRFCTPSCSGPSEYWPTYHPAILIFGYFLKTSLNPLRTSDEILTPGSPRSISTSPWPWIVVAIHWAKTRPTWYQFAPSLYAQGAVTGESTATTTMCWAQALAIT